MTVTPYDFRRPTPLAPKVRVPLMDWLTRTGARLTEQWARLSITAQLTLDSVSTEVAASALSTWSDKSVAYPVTQDPERGHSLIAIPNPLMQELIARVLGDQTPAVSAERALSPAEQSVAEFLGDSLVQGLTESWQGESPVHVQRQAAEADIRRTRLLRPSEIIVVARTRVTTASGVSHWDWLMSLDFLAGLYGLEAPGSTQGTPESRRARLEQHIREMSVELSVRLGRVQLNGPQLSALRVGDVVVLDQRVDQPLPAMVQGEAKFLGWAGRTGQRQAIEIHAAIGPRNGGTAARAG